MKHLLLIFIAWGTFTSSIPAQTLPHREPIEWCDVWMPHANKEDYPRVLLIGDSIAKGYSGHVEKLLAGKAYVARLATSRGICDPVLLDEIRALIKHHKFAVIHFNNGLHGIGYSDEEYEAGFKQLLQVLSTEASDAKLVWATSTLVQPGYRQSEKRNPQCESRNAIGLRLTKAASIPCNDLHAVTKDRPEFYAGDKIHFLANGYTALGTQVAASVIKALPETKPR